MKKHVLNFLRRGAVSFGFGPLVLAVVYLTLSCQGVVENLTVREVCTGIFSLSVLAFVAGGMNFIYKIERFPLAFSILIHGSVLYLTYLATYLLNGWLQNGVVPILVFSTVFVFGFFAIWGVIFLSVKRKTKRLNEILNQNR